MEKFRKIWDKEKQEWLLCHTEVPKKELYKLFLIRFPDAYDVTETAFSCQRSRIGAVKHKRQHGSTKCRPLYSEHIKKGYIRIKIAQPNVWISKSKWVYMETHPWEDVSEPSNYIFLDGNPRNFAPDNIERVPLKIMGIFAELGGRVQDNPALTRLNINRAKLHSALLDVAEKTGSAVRIGTARRFRADINRKAREYNSTPERRKMKNTHAKIYWQKLKTEKPEEYMRRRERNRIYQKEWYKNKRRK